MTQTIDHLRCWWVSVDFNTGIGQRRETVARQGCLGGGVKRERN